MQNRSVFALIFIGFFVVYGESAPVTDGSILLATVETTFSTINADPSTSKGATTVDSSATTVTDTSSGTGAPQNTASNGPGNTVTGGTGSPDSTATGITNVVGSTPGNAQTTATPAPQCPSKDITYIKDLTAIPWDVTVPASHNCTYYARSADFTKTIKFDNPSITGTGAVLLIFANGDKIYDSSSGGSTTPATSTPAPTSTKASQIIITVVSKDAEAEVQLSLSLEEDKCVDDTVCNHGTCKVVMGQETCTCESCYLGTKCNIKVDPCATYLLSCGAQTCEPDTSIPGTCKAKCV